jgi:hypothetical protein
MKVVLESSYVVGIPTVTETILKAKSRYNNKDIIAHQVDSHLK